jgi:hypothetical protein
MSNAHGWTRKKGDTMEAMADECKKLLDNGWGVVLYKNDLGSYTAIAVPLEDLPPVNTEENHITDDFTPSKALYRLTEKVTTGRIA